MREIKFRAYDLKLKKWQNNLCVGIQNFKSEDVVFMQYTGLKDKNGVEIYEGDIVKDKYNNIGSVRYEFGALVILRTCGWFNKDTGNQFEVIGNIYENKELQNV